MKATFEVINDSAMDAILIRSGSLNMIHNRHTPPKIIQGEFYTVIESDTFTIMCIIGSMSDDGMSGLISCQEHD